MATSKRRKPQADETPQYRPRNCSSYYREMLLIRRFEEKAGQLYGMGLIGGFCHLYIGQEAVAVGIQNALQPGRQRDHRLPRPRPHAGLRHGPERRHGRADRAPRRLLEGQGRLDAHVRPREGLLRRPRHRRRPRCRSAPASPSPTSTAGRQRSASAYLGDGAVNQGQVYESFNMAALWKLPVVYVIENNRYAMGTSQHRASAGRPVRARQRLRHPRPCRSTAWTCWRCKEGRRGGRACPRRQGPGHPRGEDLPLPRPFDVRPGEVPHQGRGAGDARAEHDPIENLRKVIAGERVDRRGRVQDDRQGIRDIVNEAARIRPGARSPIPRELWTDVLVEMPVKPDATSA